MRHFGLSQMSQKEECNKKWKDYVKKDYEI